MNTFRKSSPVDVLQGDWLSMEDELSRSADREREAHRVAIQLQTENDMMAEELDRAKTELSYWRSYVIQIETKLDMITGVITEARDGARRVAKAYTEEQKRQAMQEPQQEPQVVERTQPSETQQIAPQTAPRAPKPIQINAEDPDPELQAIVRNLRPTAPPANTYSNGGSGGR